MIFLLGKVATDLIALIIQYMYMQICFIVFLYVTLFLLSQVLHDSVCKFSNVNKNKVCFIHDDKCCMLYGVLILDWCLWQQKHLFNSLYNK